MILAQYVKLGLEVPDEAATNIRNGSVVAMPYHTGIIDLQRGEVAAALRSMEVQYTYYSQQINLAQIALHIYYKAHRNSKAYDDLDFPLNLDQAQKELPFALAGKLAPNEAVATIRNAERALRDFDAFLKQNEDFFNQNWSTISSIHRSANLYAELHVPVRIANLIGKITDEKLSRDLKDLNALVVHAYVCGHTDLQDQLGSIPGLKSLEPQAVHEYLFALERKIRGEI